MSARAGGWPAALALCVALAPRAGAQQDPLEAWTIDAGHFVVELERLHPDPWHAIEPEELGQALDEFLSEITTDEERNVVGFMRLAAMLSRDGREGHALVWPLGAEVLPLRLYAFGDGWFVVEDRSGADLVGWRVLAVAGMPVDDAARRLAPLLSHDNGTDLTARLPGALVTPALLRGAGIQPAPGPVALRCARDGVEREVALAPAAGHAAPAPPPPVGDLPSARGRERPWRSEVLDGRALYVQVNEVRAADDAGGTLAAFAATLAPRVAAEGLERVVVDVRWNGGGDNTTFGPLLDALRDPRVDRPRRLFCLVGRHTFSAAANFATALERETGALLVGEPTGGAPNQYGDPRAIQLAHHPELLVRVATRYHAFAAADDERLTLVPDLPVALESADCFAGRDAALAAALAHAPDAARSR